MRFFSTLLLHFNHFKDLWSCSWPPRLEHQSGPLFFLSAVASLWFSAADLELCVGDSSTKITTGTVRSSYLFNSICSVSSSTCIRYASSSISFLRTRANFYLYSYGGLVVPCARVPWCGSLNSFLSWRLAPDLKLLEEMCKMFKRCKRLPLPSQGKGGAKLKLFKIFDHFQQAKNAGIK